MLKAIEIRPMTESDIDGIVRTFAKWGKERAQYQRYCDEQQKDERVVLVGLDEDEIVGYVTIVWKSGYASFRKEGIPEIVDLNVITEYQRLGIGTALIRTTESMVSKHLKPVIGISVEQSPNYDAANRLYLKLGYYPDGKGITPHDNEIHLIKRLSSNIVQGQKLPNPK